MPKYVPIFRNPETGETRIPAVWSFHSERLFIADSKEQLLERLEKYKVDPFDSELQWFFYKFPELVEVIEIPEDQRICTIMGVERLHNLEPDEARTVPYNEVIVPHFGDIESLSTRRINEDELYWISERRQWIGILLNIDNDPNWNSHHYSGPYALPPEAGEQILQKFGIPPGKLRPEEALHASPERLKKLGGE